MGVVDFCKIETRDDLFLRDHLPKLLLLGPLLRQISVDGCSRRGFNTVPLTGDFPSLESLHIHRFPMPISNLHAPNLRSLKLVGELDLEDLLALFESSPLLERLHFRVELYRNVSAGARRNIVLEKVKQAKFCLDAFKILQYLLLPASNEIVINISGTQGNYTQLLSQALDGFPMCRQVQSMSFPSEGYHSQSALLKGPNGTLELVTGNIRNPTTILRLLTQHSTKSIQELQLPNIHLSSFMDYDIVEGILQSLESLRSIRMDGASVSACLFAQRVTRRYLPQLEEIATRNPNFGALQKFVQDRSKAGIPIRRLFIKNDTYTPMYAGAMKPLKDYVCDVHGLCGP